MVPRILLVFACIAAGTTSCTRPDEGPAVPSSTALTSESPSPTFASNTTVTAVDLLESSVEPDDGTGRIPVEECKITDITASSPDGVARFGSGFPIPNSDRASFLDATVWVLRIRTADLATDEESYDLTVKSFDRITEFFTEQSFGRANIRFVHDRDDVIVDLPLTSFDYGLDSVSPQEDMSYVMNTVLDQWKVPQDFKDGDQFLGLLPLAPTRPSVAQGFPIFRDLGGKQSGFGMLMTPGNATNWTLVSHEIGHSWLFLEDLYSFGIQGPYQNYLDSWDVMAAPGGPNLGFTSWTRWRVGWIDDEQIRCTTIDAPAQYFVARLDGVSAATKAIVVPTSDHSVVVTEVREGFGANAGRSIVVVYEVDTSFEHGNGPIRLRGTLREVGDEVSTGGARLVLDALDASGGLITFSNP